MPVNCSEIFKIDVILRCILNMLASRDQNYMHFRHYWLKLEKNFVHEFGGSLC
jgi:hypothetical protein